MLGRSFRLGFILPTLLTFSVASVGYVTPQPLWAQPIPINQTEGDRQLQAAERFFEEGNFSLALENFQQALAIYDHLEHNDGKRRLLLKLGATYEILGQYENALTTYETAVVFFRAQQDLRNEGAARSGVGVTNLRLGRYSEAIAAYQQALDIRKQTQDINGEAISLSGLGVVYTRLGDYQRALTYHQAALNIRHRLPSRYSIPTSLHNLGMVYEALGDYPQALKHYQQALDLYEEFNNLTGQERSLGSLANIFQQQGDTTQAMELLKHALVISQSIQDPLGEGLLLTKMGFAHEQLGNTETALQTYRQALQIGQEINNPVIASISLRKIAGLLEQTDQIELAITFYKEFVNVVETIRQNIDSLPEETQLAFVQTVEETYRHLASLLLQQDRVLESQQILDLLKVQELDAYLRDVRGSTTNSVSFWQPEKEILQQFNEFQNSAIELGKELSKLQKIPSAERTAEQQQRILDLVTLEEALNRQFNAFLESDEILNLVEQLGSTTRRQALNLEDIARLRDELTQLNAALLYPLILDDRLELVITTPDAPPLRRTVNVSKNDLNQAILTMRQALEFPFNDAQQPAQQLYQWLVEPLEPILAETNVDTIIYAPDGQLRYIPLAALHDGEQWLAERYTINYITARSLTDLQAIPAANPRVLAGAFANPTLSYSVQVGQRQVYFQGLPFAGIEVESLAAILPKTISYIDEAFSLEAVRSHLNEYDILHFATHAAFFPGLPEDSFILFGNGDHSTLTDVRNWSLHNVDLVVLSACETGLGGFGNGEEILGLGYQFQRAGARAIMASLWQVNDKGTQILMYHFYQALQQGKNKAAALQQAQQAMITNNISTTDRSRGAFEATIFNTENPTAIKNNLSHPYYWAPFILLGNGL